MTDAVMTHQDDLFQPFEPGEGLRAQSVRGGALSMIAQGAKFASMSVTTILLARILTPEDFGIVAFAMAFVSIGYLFKDLGLADATVQRPIITRAQVSNLVWWSGLIGLGVAALLAGASLVIGVYVGDRRFVPVMASLSLLALFGGLTLQHQALLRRRMRFRALAVVEITASGLAAAAAIVAGLLGVGVWALVLFQLTYAAVIAIGVWIAAGWLPSRPSRGAGASRMLLFGVHLTTSNSLRILIHSLDKALVFWKGSAETLGYYSKAYNLLILPIQQLTLPIHGVAVAALSRIAGDAPRYNSYYRRGLLMLASAAFPGMGWFVVSANHVIPIALGDQWDASVPLFRLLAPAGLATALDASVMWVYVTSDRADRQFRWGVGSTIVAAVGLLIGVNWGAAGVATALSVVLMGSRLAEYPYCFRGSGITLGTLGSALWRPALATALAMGAAWLVSGRLPTAMSDVPSVLIEGGVFGVAYALVWSLAPGGLGEVRHALSLVSDLIPGRSAR
ncbi:MAG: lipopolysaccharide biosynthesis protein [Phycisphaeraceae bacterium]|nr:lipopolysaccharide biosynthesis protein [Phycisphaeraceae bacterium]